MVNKNHKDRLFRMIFGYEKYKGNLLSLYNALNDTNYENPDDLEINTIDDVIFMGMKNDVSCIIDSKMSLYEQQSSFNPNMPLRGFMYFGKLYNKYLQKNRLNIYGTHLIQIPAPQYYVFYNGISDYPDKIVLRLSDAFFTEQSSGEFEWTATMLNINCGKNKTLMEKCKILREYAILIETIRRYRNTCEDIQEAVIKAVEECIGKGILTEYLLEHKAEVIDMCLTEYNEAETMELFKKEAREEGKAEGIKEGEINILKGLVREGVLTKEQAAQRLDMSVESFEKIILERR